MEENLQEIQIDENTTVITDDPELATDIISTSDSEDGINPVVVAGIVAGIGALGYGAYKGVKKLGTWLSDKMEDSSSKRLLKRGYTVIPPRTSEDLHIVEEEELEEEEIVEETSDKKKK